MTIMMTVMTCTIAVKGVVTGSPAPTLSWTWRGEIKFIIMSMTMVIIIVISRVIIIIVLGFISGLFGEPRGHECAIDVKCDAGANGDVKAALWPKQPVQ